MSSNIDVKNKIKIIYAEDDKATKNLLNDIFKYYDFIDLDIVSSGEELIETFKNNKYDLILADIKMGKINGLDAIETIKNEHPDISSIVVSSFKENDYLQRAIEIGINEYFYKPLNVKLLITAITTIYERKIEKLKKNLYQNRIRKAINISNIGVFVFKKEKETLHWDKAMDTIYSSKSMEFLPEWLNAIEKSDKDKFLNIFRNDDFRNDETFDEIIKVKVNNKIKYIRFTGFIENIDDNFEIVGINEDVTEFITSKLEVIKQKDQLKLALIAIEKKNKRLEKAYKKLDEQQQIIVSETKSNAINETIKTLAHEWRQPLSFISMTTQSIILEKQFGEIDFPDSTEESLEQIINTTSDLSSTIEKITTLINESNKNDKEMFNMIDAINDVKGLLKEVLNSNEIKIEFKYNNKKDDFDILTNKNDFKSMISTILINSIEVLNERKIKDKYIY